MKIELPVAHLAKHEQTTAAALTAAVAALLAKQHRGYDIRLIDVSTTASSASNAGPAASAPAPRPSLAEQARRGVLRWQVRAGSSGATAGITARLERVYYDSFGLRLHMTGLHHEGAAESNETRHLCEAAIAVAVAFGRQRGCYQIMADCPEQQLPLFAALNLPRVGVSMRCALPASVAAPGPLPLLSAQQLLASAATLMGLPQAGLHAHLVDDETAASLAPLAGVPSEDLALLRAAVADRAQAQQFTVMLRAGPAEPALAMANVLLEDARWPDGRRQGLLTGVAVAPSARRQQLGSAISRLAAGFCGQAGAHSLALDCFATADAGPEAYHQALYEKIGFRVVGAWAEMPLR